MDRVRSLRGSEGRRRVWAGAEGARCACGVAHGTGCWDSGSKPSCQELKRWVQETHHDSYKGTRWLVCHRQWERPCDVVGGEGSLVERSETQQEEDPSEGILWRGHAPLTWILTLRISGWGAGFGRDHTGVSSRAALGAHLATGTATSGRLFLHCP